MVDFSALTFYCWWPFVPPLWSCHLKNCFREMFMHVQRTARGHSPGQTVIHVEMMVCHHQSHPTMLTTNGEAEELWQSWRHRLFWTTTETRQSSGTTRGRWSLGSLKNCSMHGPIDPLATEYAPLYNTCKLQREPIPFMWYQAAAGFYNQHSAWHCAGCSNSSSG